MHATDYLTPNSKFSFTLLEVITNFTKIFPTCPLLIYLSLPQNICSLAWSKQ